MENNLNNTEEAIEKLKISLNEVANTANIIVNMHHQAIYEKAPIIIYQRLCQELVGVVKENENKAPKDIPKAIDILKFVDILHELYPELKNKI